MLEIWAVGWDGMLKPVKAETKEIAEQKLRTHLEEQGVQVSFVVAQKASKGYLDWVSMCQIEIIK